jgi:GDP-L-fucose synthase
MRLDARIYVAGGQTLIGAALLRQLAHQGFAGVCGSVDEEPDLADADDVEAFFQRRQPEFVFLAAGKSAGIAGNQKYPADLIHNNLVIAVNVIGACHRHGVHKLLYLASSCSYPRLCAQPMRVESLLSGPLEPTNEAYAVAKLAGLKMCQAYRQQYGDRFIVGIPANSFGPGDDYSPEDSHVVGALLRRMHEAKIAGRAGVSIWGTGTPRREFLYVDDLADACLFVMDRYDEWEPLNLGVGQDVSIRELAQLIRTVVGYTGELQFDTTRPDGMPLKSLDGSRLAQLGWKPRTTLREALETTYRDFLVQLEPLRQQSSENQPTSHEKVNSRA